MKINFFNVPHTLEIIKNVHYCSIFRCIRNILACLARNGYIFVYCHGKTAQWTRNSLLTSFVSVFIVFYCNRESSCTCETNKDELDTSDSNKVRYAADKLSLLLKLIIFMLYTRGILRFTAPYNVIIHIISSH